MAPDPTIFGEPSRGPFRLAEYDPSWPARFSAHATRLRSALGDVALRIEHIGSTAVPGLAAKPIVDILVVVADPEAPSLAEPLRGAGYELRVVEPGHRMFRTPSRDVHVHLWADGAAAQDYLRLRELLRRDAAARAEYEALKRSLAARDWPSMDDYAEAKGPLIRSLLARAPRPTRP
ncbi:MAG TPA: GrpB family protein [Solirubrobacteraceae bacterium]